MWTTVVNLALFLISAHADDSIFEILGELEFECPHGWIIHKANCYKKVVVEMTFNEASTTCNLEGAHMLYLANEIEYDEVIAHNAPGMNIWMGFETNGTHIGRNVTGFDTPSDRIPRWANNEPAPNMHGVDCILVDYMKGLMVRACDELHPFFCKRRACLKGYMSCDTATKCVREVRKCDGKLDCLDTRDELDCPNDMNYIDVETSGTFSTRTLYSGQQRIWTMKAPIGRRIKLYVPSMTLETNVAFLEVWTGNITFAVSRLIKRFTGTVSAGVYLYSDNNYMTVRLYANNLQQNFDAKTLSYTADNTNIYLGYKDLDATVVLTPLIFPYQGLEYKPEGLHLRRRITAHGGDYITYYVEPIDKTKPTSGKIRGGMTYLEPGDVRVTGRNELHITMEGVPENLQLMYKSGCGDITLMHEYGTIKLFDELIPNNATCTWTLKGGEAVGRGLALKFMNDLYDDPRTTLATKSMDIFTIEGSGGTKTGVENYPEMIYHSSDGTFKVTFQSDVALNSKSSSFDFGADCPMLDVSEQTKMNKNTTYFDEDVLLTCPTGYDFHLEKYASRTSLTLRCTKGSWYIDDDKLAAIPECKMVFCGAPPKVNNAYVTYASGGSYMSVATYACNPGFNMAGGPNATCMDSGEWGGYPSCSSTSCNALPDNLVLNGRLEIRGGNTFTGGNADFDTVVQFFCNDGYELVGTVRTHCNASGWTHGTTPPTCQRLSCEKPSLPNGVYNPVGEIQFEDTLTATCNAGYQFKDNPGSLSLTMTCRADQTFDTVDECIDIDECQAGTSGCDLDSTACRNNVGGRECICKDGFNNPTGETTCSDINECLVNNGGCYNMANCENAQGSYSCTCPSGHKLFETNGDQGFTLQASETGLGENDMYRINHTCVPLECPELPGVQNGWYLTSETQFHFNEEVDIHCADGYFFASDGTNTSNTDGKLTCTAAGNWDIIPSCYARECTLPVKPLNGMYDTEKVAFGEQLTLTCNLSESEQISRQAICLYNGTEKGVVFGGDDITVCPEINCGDPDDVMPPAGTYAGNKPPTFTYWQTTSQFTFDCSAGSSVTGQSEDGDVNVKCKANGRWSLNSLGCLGVMCMDPGTPGDANQIASSYEIGATLGYACTRTGFKPTGPENYTCGYINGAAVWSDNLDNVLPTCKADGEQCEDIYHICCGNPCTNGGTCVSGDGPTDYTCTCVTDYDICIMETKAEMMIGNATGQIGYSIVQDKAECEQLCLDDENCIEATFLTSSGGISACRLFNIAAYLKPATIAGTVHMAKHCTSGFTGDNCEVDNIDNCNNSQCHENSRCIDKINGYECICSSSGGFGGQYCNTSTDPCDDSPCQHGTCKSFENVRYECTCLDGYDGINCDNNINECNAHPDACMYGGTCVDRVNGYQCNCMTGFTGEHCENVPNYCLPGDCQEGNVCYTSLDAHDGVCSCDTRFFEPVFICDMQDTTGTGLGDPVPEVIGGPRIVQSIQECKDLCQYETNCGYAIYQEFPTSKACILYRRGTLNETVNAGSTLIKKDCSTEGTHYNCNRNSIPCDTIACDNNGICSDNGYVAICQCAAGFWGTRCQYSVDDCVNNNCQNGAVCVDGYLDFTCECLEGFEGNQCETNTDDCPGLCTTTQGSCVDLVDGYNCVCKPGYQDSNCELEIDECLSYPCKHGADCEDMVNDYSCMCEEGWTGKNCDTEIDHCKSRTCQNSGQCFNLPESSFCRCEGGALGENCENATLVCDVMSGTDVCQNRGLCTNKPGTASCECPPDYDVRRCYFDEGRVGIAGGTSETLELVKVQSLDECKTRCLNNPNCSDVVFVTLPKDLYCYLYEREKFVSTSEESTRVHYRRICPTDYTGDSCEQVKDWCSDENNPCENGGECTPKGPVGYTCMCKPGYSGVTCNIDADPCSTTPCAGVAKCQSTVTEHICQCEQGKIFTGSQCRDDPTRPVILVNNLFGVLDAPTLQTPFRWTTQTISIMFMIRVHASPDNELASLLNIYVQNSLNPNYQDYMYWISVSRRGIGVKTNMSPWLGVTFNEDFGSELGDGSWHHLGIAINENGMLSATLDAITIDDAVEVVSPPAGVKNVQISLGYLNLAEYQDVSVWNVTLTSRDFALASVGTQPSVNPIQGWWNYDPKTSGMRLTERLPHNLLDDPNINFPQMNCDGFENIMHVSAERVVDRDTFVGKIEEVKENTNGTLTFKHSLPPSLTWGFYETVIVGVNSNTLNYGECRVQLVVKYNDVCPAARSDNTESEVCPSGADAVCDLACLEPNKALFAPVSKYISCGTLGVWDTRKPYDDLVLPGCTISGDPRYAVTSMMKFETVIPCGNLDINTKVTDRLTDVLMNDFAPVTCVITLQSQKQPASAIQTHLKLYSPLHIQARRLLLLVVEKRRC
ncbi:uncharacterized protein LOC128221951 [Mya arenaria]|uniref:uncharacterized protein LOC128221951 n=1 Tax=Mya arenaria TaxID=6604 RepID=UPI0022E355E2|nr:uncharacterized protein LOC128221951 [Mya arenaria]